jgi:fructose-bisphosphate aldolase class 1
MDKDTKRMEEIQKSLIDHIQKNLKSDEDFMYMATMLLKHSMVLYKTFLDDDQIKKMLDHVGETLSDDLHNAEKYYDDGSTPPTVH